MKIFDIIIRPLITEKSSDQQANKQYTFVVNKTATKIDIKHAIKEIYGVEVKEVKIMITPKKSRLIRRGRLWTKRPPRKKAIVTIKGNKTIDPNKINSAKRAKK